MIADCVALFVRLLDELEIGVFLHLLADAEECGADVVFFEDG